MGLEMKYSELKKLENSKLLETLSELKNEYIDKKMAINNNSLKDTSVLSKLKQDVARIKTLLNERKYYGKEVFADKAG